MNFMIEVEIKIPSTDGNYDALTKDAEFQKEIKMHDVYFDTDNYSLTSRDMWLRERNGSFELKIPLHGMDTIATRQVDQYRELENEKEIRGFLNMGEASDFKDLLAKKGYKPVIDMTTIRKKYRNGEFTIDIDTTDFGFNLAEVEVLVKNESEASKAQERIFKFVRIHGFTPANKMGGKVIEYLRRKNRKHLQVLVQAGVVAE